MTQCSEYRLHGRSVGHTFLRNFGNCLRDYTSSQLQSTCLVNALRDSDRLVRSRNQDVKSAAVITEGMTSFRIDQMTLGGRVSDIR
jgi:hypothetical protein